MSKKVKISFFQSDFPITDFSNPNWQKAEEISGENYWSGKPAPVGRHFKTKLLWSEIALYVRFEANQAEPLVVSEKANLQTKTYGLWERDVCEIFVAPDAEDFRKYFEFEIAPNGEWIDLAIHQKPNERITDWENYRSGMESFAKIESDKIVMALKIEWKAFNRKPKVGDVWKGNIFRCVGAGETRGYLAWSPTETEKPNFHVPEKFVGFIFSD